MLPAYLTRRRMILTALPALLYPSAAQPQPRSDSSRPPLDLVIAQGGEVSGLDPHFSTSLPDTIVSFNLFDTLVAPRGDQRLAPSLATGWEMVGPTIWRFRLRQGALFHNGDPLTAADVKFSLERVIDPAARTLVRSALETLERVETPDRYTVLCHTKAPDPLLPARLTSYGGQILPMRYLIRVGDDAFRAQPIGSGPVRFVEWVKGDRLVVDAVPDYWDGRIAPDRVTFRPVPEIATRIGVLLRGEADIVTGVPPDHADRVAAHPRSRTEEALYAGLYVLAVDGRHPPLDRPKVVQALSLAIDRETIVQELWRGRGIVPNGPIPRGDDFYDPSLPPLRHGPGLARQRLREAGYAGEPIVLETTAGQMTNDRMASEAVIAMWRDIGVNAKLELIESSVRARKIREKSFKGLRWAQPSSPLRDPDGMMWRGLGPGGNHDMWRNPEFDRLGREARVSLDPAFRARAYREMTRLFLEYLPWIPIIQPTETYGVRRDIEWTPSANQRLELRRFNLRLRGS